MLGLHCCAGFPLAVVSGAYPRLLVAEASLVAGTGSRARGLSGCGSRAPERRLNSCDACTLLIRDAWDLPGSGIEPMSPAVAGRFFITEPPGKPHLSPPFFFAMMIGGISV